MSNQSKKEISEDIKMNLRGVLLTKAGMKQSEICKEYKDMVQEFLSFSKYGFKTFYEFLSSLEGEVLRMEFSPKDKDNLVYGIQDKSKYASGHAIKNANKERTGLKSKSPEEIRVWMNGGISLKPQLNSQLQSKMLFPPKSNPLPELMGSILPNASSDVIKRLKENLPTTQEWDYLKKLTSNHAGEYRLWIKRIGANTYLSLTRDELRTHFSPYNCSTSISFHEKGSSRTAFVPFKTYAGAYYAWKQCTNTTVCGNQIFIAPAEDRSLDHRKLNENTLGSIKIMNLPQNMLMTTLVIACTKYKDMMKIFPLQRERAAIVLYKTRASANLASSEITSLKGLDGKDYPVKVQVITGDVQQQSSINQAPSILNQQLSKSTVADQSASFFPKTISPKQIETTVDIEKYDHLKCGFCLDYQLSHKMFQSTYKRPPRTAQTVAAEIKFLVTYPVDACRFWILIMDDKRSNEKLAKVQTDLAEAAQRIKQPDALPKEGQRGAALFVEDESWYRCYVISSNEDKMEIEVFFCDYGNTAIIEPKLFRNTYSDVWSLPPMAVPCKFFGFECPHPKSSQMYNDGTQYLAEMTQCLIMTAKVVKNADYSQPHIIELCDVHCNESKSQHEILEHTMMKKKFLTKIIEEKMTNMEDTVELNRLVTSIPIERGIKVLEMPDEKEEIIQDEEQPKKDDLFHYDEENLVFGKIAIVHKPNLLYLHLGTMEEMAKLELALQKATTQKLTKCDVKKGNILLKFWKKQIRRVLVLAVSPYRDNRVKVLHVDYGEIESLQRDVLFVLQPELRNQAFQARPASLAGIDRSYNLQNAISYMKKKINLPIKAKITDENSTGKLSVVLFPMESSESFNEEMIKLGLAMPRGENAMSNFDDESVMNFSVIGDKEPFINSLELSPTQRNHLSFPAHTPVQSLIGSTLSRNNTITNSNTNSPQTSSTIRRNSISNSSAHSWNSKDSKPSFYDGPSNPRQQVNNVLKKQHVHKHEDVKRWVNNTSNFSDGKRSCENIEKVSFDGEFLRPNTPPYPPPDIVSSNTKRPIQIEEGVYMEDNKIYIGKTPDGCDILTLDENNRLCSQEVEALRNKWNIVQKEQKNIVSKLEYLMDLPKDELEEKFKEMKRLKLKLKLKLKEAKGKLDDLTSTYDAVIDETNKIYAEI